MGERFGVQYSVGHLWRLLRRLGFSCQKPEKRALQRNEPEIVRCKRHGWPALKKSPARRPQHRLHRRIRLERTAQRCTHLESAWTTRRFFGTASPGSNSRPLLLCPSDSFTFASLPGPFARSRSSNFSGHSGATWKNHCSSSGMARQFIAAANSTHGRRG
ncbi:winged helix-turn-helix domain-containing protein [Verminephrobacter eiseniae]|nr:winged helix-turn-helix domain-containing protein [Verminephrobacter eiseniae]MCW5302327.1 winged helix-turn-helix domain-containing protein [Verminephrobacter eiseniae]MCW8181120.1 winged helix-turn-helix domain-containing protein [Verminephrobacter eiseniae]MCW8192318.1 winged helix-turn-helix domain-containing protein [Verminephrobacter eiseniae]